MLIRLDHLQAFTRAKLELVRLYENRAVLPLHEVEFREYKEHRGPKANAYWWVAVVTPLAKELGYTPEECHEVLLCEILGTKIVEFRGKQREVPRRRSHDMNSKEFADLIEHGSRIAAEMGVFVEPYSVDGAQPRT